MNRWFVVLATPADADAAADALWSAGVDAIEEFWRSDGVVELRIDLARVSFDVDALAALLPERTAWRVEHGDAARPRPHRAAEPIRATDRLVIVPVAPDDDAIEGAQHDHTDALATTVMLLDARHTFGTGDHPTTLACLGLLDAAMGERAGGPVRVLDVGCGSGVLGIAALLWGAELALGVDITPESVAMSTANARRNGVAERWRAITEPLGTIAARFDIVLANVLGPTLVELAPDLRRLVTDDGLLVVSGVLAGTEQPVLEALHPLRMVRQVEIDGWLAAVLTAPATRTTPEPSGPSADG